MDNIVTGFGVIVAIILLSCTEFWALIGLGCWVWGIGWLTRTLWNLF